MRLAIEGIKKWVESPACIGYIKRVDGNLASVYEGVALWTDDTTSRAWTIQQPPGPHGYEISPYVYLDPPQIDILNDPVEKLLYDQLAALTRYPPSDEQMSGMQKTWAEQREEFCQHLFDELARYREQKTRYGRGTSASF